MDVCKIVDQNHDEGYSASVSRVDASQVSFTSDSVMDYPTPSLTINWAVFLPLGAPTSIELSLPFRVSKYLHGYFFTDAGRNGRLIRQVPQSVRIGIEISETDSDVSIDFDSQRPIQPARLQPNGTCCRKS